MLALISSRGAGVSPTLSSSPVSLERPSTSRVPTPAEHFSGLLETGVFQTFETVPDHPNSVLRFKLKV